MIKLTENERSSLAEALESHSAWLSDWTVRGVTLSVLVGHPIDCELLIEARNACNDAIPILARGKVPSKKLVAACKFDLDDRSWESRGWIVSRFGLGKER